MAKIAVETLARGEGWTVEDVICTSGPQDRPFEERHSCARIAIVVAGSFQYRSAGGHELLTPGSLLVGNAGQSFQCAHEHGEGDRCISFGYAPDFFERLAADAGAARSDFRRIRVPPLRALAPLVARASAGLTGSMDVSWEEISVKLAARTVRLADGLSSHRSDPSTRDVSRVARTVRTIERHPDARLTLRTLARRVGLSPYHFLRTFERLTGVTPHQYIVRARLRAAAKRLASERGKVIDIALDCGFGDVSNFNRAFRNEFGVSPRVFRRA